METGDPGTPGGAPDDERGGRGEQPPGQGGDAPAPPPRGPGWSAPVPPWPPPGQGWPAAPGSAPGAPGPPGTGPSPPSWPPPGQGWPTPPGPSGPPDSASGASVPPGLGLTPPPAAARPPEDGGPPVWTPDTPGIPPPPPGYPPGAAPGAYWSGYAPAPGGALRPRGIGELLDGAFSLYRRNFLLLVAIAAVVQVPFAVVQLIVFSLADLGNRFNSLQDLSRTAPNQGVLTPAQNAQLTGDVGAFLAYLGVVFVLQFLVVYPLSQAATTSAVSARYLDQSATVGSSYRAALSRWRPLVAMVLWLTLVIAGTLGVAVLLGALTGSGAVAVIFILAGLAFFIVVVVRTTLAPQAIVIERLSGRAGLRRSWRLTDGSFWRVLGIRVLLWLLQVIMGLVLSLPFTAIASATASSGTQQMISQIVQAVTTIFVAPITLVTLTLLYYDLRIRREGFDIEMLASSL